MVGTYLPPWQEAPGLTLRDGASRVFVCLHASPFPSGGPSICVSVSKRALTGEETERAANKIKTPSLAFENSNSLHRIKCVNAF